MLDLTAISWEEDDVDEPGSAADRDYWERRGSPTTLAIADSLLEMVNSVSPGHDLKYNKFYIGLARSGIVDNFAIFRARKDFLVAEFRIEHSEELSARLSESGMDELGYDTRWSRYRLRLASQDPEIHRALLLDLIRRSVGEVTVDELDSNAPHGAGGELQLG